MFPHRIQFALCWFQSPLLTASLLISFPPGTKTFQFPGFPVLSDLMRSRIQKSLVQRIHAPRQSLMQLVTSFFGLNEPSHPSNSVVWIIFHLMHGLINMICGFMSLPNRSQVSTLRTANPFNDRLKQVFQTF